MTKNKTVITSWEDIYWSSQELPLIERTIKTLDDLVGLLKELGIEPVRLASSGRQKFIIKKALEES